MIVKSRKWFFESLAAIKSEELLDEAEFIYDFAAAWKSRKTFLSLNSFASIRVSEELEFNHSESESRFQATQ